MASVSTSAHDRLRSPASEDGDGDRCPECGSRHMVTDEEAVEVWCGSCGVQFSPAELPPRSLIFEDGFSSGVSLEHLPDKNLTTDFRPSDIARTRPEEYAKFRNLRWLNRVIPQRSGQSACRNITLRLRPLLERLNLPGEVVRRTVLKASRVVAETGLLRVDGTYEGLALLALRHADRKRFLRMGEAHLISLLARSAPKEVLRVDLGAPEVRSDSVEEWSTPIPLVGASKPPESLCFVSAHLYLNGRQAEGPAHHLTASVPVRFLRNPPFPGCLPVSPPQAEKRKAGFCMSISTDRFEYVRGRDSHVLAHTVLFKGSRDNGVKKAYATLSNGGAWHIVKKAYNAWCTLLREPVDPASIEELDELNPYIRRGLLSRVDGKARHILLVWNSTPGLQPITERVAAALACYSLLGLAESQIEEAYGVPASVVRAHYRTLKKYDT